MLMDPKFSSWVDKHIVHQETIRRHADGSIDYAYYDQRARDLRAGSFVRPFRVIATGIRAIAKLFGKERP